MYNLGIFQVDKKLITLNFSVKVPLKNFRPLVCFAASHIARSASNYLVWQYPSRSIWHLMCIVP